MSLTRMKIGMFAVAFFTPSVRPIILVLYKIISVSTLFLNLKIARTFIDRRLKLWDGRSVFSSQIYW